MQEKELIIKELGVKATRCEFGEDGCRGTIWRNNIEMQFIFSWGMGWEHLSVSCKHRTPTWDEMCYMKRIFWMPDEWCVQYHPAEKNYVNIHNNVLHIWRPVDGKFPVPDKILV